MSFKAAPLFVLPLLAVTTVAEAADPVASPVYIPPPAPPPAFQPLWHAHVEGGPVYSDPGFDINIFGGDDDKFGDIPDERGFYLGGALRKLFRPNLTWQIAVTGTWFDPLIRFGDDGGVDARLASDVDFQTLDIDLGFGDLHNRAFAGLRVLHVTDFLSYENEDGDFGSIDAAAWLLGPRVGVAAELPLGNSQFSFLAELSGSALFGHANIDTAGNIFDPTPVSGQRTTYNVEGLVGLGIQLGQDMRLTVGYRGQQWWGLRNADFLGTDDAEIDVSDEKLIHGPFARFAIDW
jgi:hypothetical protein